MHKKKGLLALTSLAGIVLWVVGTIILLVFAALVINQATASSAEVVCRNSVALRAKATISIPLGRVEIGRIEKFTPLMCDPIPMGKLQGTREEIKHQISDLAARCWWMYLEGSVANIFDSKTKDEKTCGICYYFQIPDDMDGGRINPEFVYFQELSKKNMTILKREEPDLEGLEFEYEIVMHEGEQIIRPKALISQQEIYNFLLSQKYDPNILYGGGNINYIGDVHSFTSVIQARGQKIELRKIDSISPTHLRDYTFLITESVQTQITEFGTKLFRQRGSILQVIVADKIDRNERRDARRLIERLGLNSEKESFDAVLIILDVEQGQIRVHIGGHLERRIKEHEISAIIQTHFTTISTPQELNRALSRTIADLEQKILQDRPERELRLPEGTYYEYLSNEQTTAPIIENIMADRTYAVAYLSTSDVYTWWDGVMEHKDAIIMGAVALGITVTMIFVSIKSVGTASPLAFVAIKGAWAGVIGAGKGLGMAAAVTYTYLALTDQSFVDKFQTLLGRLGSGRGDNAIYILPATAISQICDDAG